MPRGRSFDSVTQTIGETPMIRINRIIEDNIRLAPEQYFWVHKRFKARGEGYPDVY